MGFNRAQSEFKPPVPSAAASDPEFFSSSPNRLELLNRVTKILRLLGWIAVFLLAILSLLPGEHRPNILVSGQAEHLVAYALTSVTLIGGYWQSRRNITIALGLTLYAGLLEALQLWVPGRVGRLPDFAMSTLGVWVGLFLLTVGARLSRRVAQDFRD